MSVVVAVSSRKANRSGFMKRCQPRQRRRRVATSGRSCSAALSAFFVPQADPVESLVERRQPLQLDQGEVGRSCDQALELALVRRQQRPSVAAEACRSGAARRPHPLHQLDRRRRADGEAARREALALAIPHLDAGRHRAARRRPGTGRAAVLPRHRPRLLRVGERWVALASEGGHASFAPDD
jgi:hypothetical protein